MKAPAETATMKDTLEPSGAVTVTTVCPAFCALTVPLATVATDSSLLVHVKPFTSAPATVVDFTLSARTAVAASLLSSVRLTTLLFACIQNYISLYNRIYLEGEGYIVAILAGSGNYCCSN